MRSNTAQLAIFLESQDEEKTNDYLLCSLHDIMFIIPGACYRHFSAQSDWILQGESQRLRMRGME